MKNLSKFQLILMAVFAGFIILGVIALSSHKSGDGVVQSPVVVWGPYDVMVFNQIFVKTGLQDNKNFSIQYAQVRPDQFDAKFVNALAEGKSPDLIFIPSESILKWQSKLLTIPYTTYSERTFKDNFIDGSEVYLMPGGVLGFPVLVDPLVMYWNRPYFETRGITQPPKLWVEFNNGLTERLTDRTQTDSTVTINKSAVALGQYVNIKNAKAILATLFMQAGTPIVSRQNIGLTSMLGSKSSSTAVSPAISALGFYTQFADSKKVTYTWNLSLPSSDQQFLAGNLGMYFGFASEATDIQKKNPNLNFDVAPVPQSQTNPHHNTYGSITALAIPKMAPHAPAAFQLVQILTSTMGDKVLADTVGLPPARRDLLNVTQPDALQATFYTSAIWAHTFLQPDAESINQIFKDMIENVTSGASDISSTIDRASATLQTDLNRISK